MMLMPRRRNDFDLLDDVFGMDSFFSDGRNKIMKTDIKEKKDKYLLDIDLPGYDKKDIEISIEDGYLNIHAKTHSENNENEEGKFVRKERFFGECSRSFYIGNDITEEDIKASFRNGILNIEIPKKDINKEIPSKKYIEIGE